MESANLITMLQGQKCMLIISIISPSGYTGMQITDNCAKNEIFDLFLYRSQEVKTVRIYKPQKYWKRWMNGSGKMKDFI